MSDCVLKLRLLVLWLRRLDGSPLGIFREWRREVWRVDLDEQMCCPGGPWDFCGCGGVTHRQQIEWDLKRIQREAGDE